MRSLRRRVGSDLDLLTENRAADEGLVRRVVELALALGNAAGLRSPHATLFVGTDSDDELERLRALWDPAMARQIGAHVTVAYPDEIASVEELNARAAAAARTTSPFRLRLGDVRRFESADDGVYVAIDDVDGGWRAIRSVVLEGRRALLVEPHVTLVHPRTSGLAAQAWQQMRDVSIAREVVCSELAVTVFDGHVWRTIGRHAFARAVSRSWTESQDLATP